MIYRKLYMDKILPFIDQPFVKILTGIRRCGKSTILQMIREKLLHDVKKKKQILYYRFDSMEHDNIKSAPDMFAELKKNLFADGKTYFLLDEVQEVDGWEKIVNSLMTDYNVDIFVTGSNSKMLSSEISTYLTGRYVSFQIFPLTFAEYLDFRKNYSEVADIHTEFKNFLKFGGFPACHLKNFSADEIYTIVSDIYNSTIFTDIVRRNQIRRADMLERIVKYIFDNIGQTFSALTLAKFIKSQNRNLDTETVYSYLEKLEKAFILYRCPRFDIKGKNFLKTQEKFYLADISMRHAILGYKSADISAFLENIIFIELKSRGYKVSVGKFDTFEIDFVAEKNNFKIYIQVTYSIKNSETERREFENLLKIKDNYPKFVIFADDFVGGNYEGIKTMNITDFLLSDDF